MVVLYYAGLFLANTGIVFSNRKYGRSCRTLFDIFVYALVAGVTACFVFFALSGFHLSFNLRTAVYALLFTGIVFISYLTTISVYKYISASLVGTLSNALALIFTSLFGFLFLQEQAGLIPIFRILLMLFAMVFSCTGNIRNPSNRRDFLWGCVLCVIASLGTLGSTVITKAFATDPLVTDSNSMFFLTNVFIVAISLSVLPAMKKGSFRHTARELKSIRPTQYLMVFVNTLCSNLQSLLSVLILAAGAVTLYAPLSTALNLLAAYAVSVCVKEKIKLIPLLLALGAVLLGAF